MAEIPCRTGKYRENLDADRALLQNLFLNQMLETVLSTEYGPRQGNFDNPLTPQPPRWIHHTAPHSACMIHPDFGADTARSAPQARFRFLTLRS